MRKINLLKSLIVPEEVMREAGIEAAILLASSIKAGSRVSTASRYFQTLLAADFINKDGDWCCESTTLDDGAYSSPLADIFDSSEWKRAVKEFSDRLGKVGRAFNVDAFRYELEQIDKSKRLETALTGITTSNAKGWLMIPLGISKGENAYVGRQDNGFNSGFNRKKGQGKRTNIEREGFKPRAT